MSVGKDRTKAGADSPDLSDEIDRTMAEAEAAVSALEREEDGAMGETDQLHPSDSAAEVEIEELGPEPDPSDQIAALQREVEVTKDKWLRAVADLENYKKRVKREIDEAVTRAVQQLLPAFLPALDNLERALEVADPVATHASEANAENIQQLLAGIEMVRKEFLAALQRNGIEPVPTVGHPFDPSMHDALQQLDSPDYPPGVVIREFERGYRRGNRLLRPARVIVAGAGSTGTAFPGEAEGEAGAEN
jgi:molecular chaperone GrpE